LLFYFHYYAFISFSLFHFSIFTLRHYFRHAPLIFIFRFDFFSFPSSFSYYAIFIIFAFLSLFVIDFHYAIFIVSPLLLPPFFAIFSFYAISCRCAAMPRRAIDYADAFTLRRSFSPLFFFRRHFRASLIIFRRRFSTPFDYFVFAAFFVSFSPAFHFF